MTHNRSFFNGSLLYVRYHGTLQLCTRIELTLIMACQQAKDKKSVEGEGKEAGRYMNVLLGGKVRKQKADQDNICGMSDAETWKRQKRTRIQGVFNSPHKSID